MKIRLKLNHIFWVAMSAVLLLVLWMIYNMYVENKEQLTQQYNQQQLNLAQEMALNLEGLFDEALSDLKTYLLNNPLIKAGDLRECELEMGLVSNKMKEVTTSLRRLDKNGVLIHIFSEDEKQKKLIGKDYRRESYFEEPKTTGRPFISDVVLEKGGKKSIYISVPLYKEATPPLTQTERAKEFGGVFAFSIDLNIITNQLLSRLQKVRNFWIMDEKGTLLVQPQHPGMEFRDIFKNEDGCLKCHSSFEIQRRMVKGETGTGKSEVKGSQENLIAFVPLNIGNRHWSLAVTTPSFEVLALAKHNLRDTLILTLILCSWFLFGSIYLFQANRKKIRAEEKVKEEQKYRNLVEHSHDAICIIQDNHFKFANQRFLELSGYNWQELSQLDFTEVIAPEHREMVADRYRRRQKGEIVPENYDFVFLTKNGERRYVEFSVSLVEYQERVASYCFLRDITERKKAEEALRESEQRYRGVVDNIGIGVSLISPNMEILFLNKQMKKWFPNVDISKEATCYRAFNNPPKEEACSYCPTNKTLQDGQIHESITDTPAGEKVINYRVISSPIKDLQGNVIAAIEMVEDITEKKRLQEQLIQTEKLAAVGTLAYGIAHEFNNILAGMMANAELGLITKDSNQIKECLETIVESSQRASSITNNLLAFARQKNAKKELVDITEPLKSVLSVTRRELEKHNVELIEKFKSIPKIYCDSGQFSEVFLNMITNARDAMYPKGGTLTIQVESAGDCIRIIFKDTGCGIPEEIKGRIFEPFVTTKGALGKSDIPGTGLGLFLSYGIIDGYKGKIEVETKVDKGAKFSIIIPICENQPRELLLDTRIESSKETEKRLKILLVDDEKAITLGLKKFLESKGHKVSTSLRAKEGLEIFRKGRFDLVLSDITIPDMDGIELIKKVKEEDPQAKIIVITGHIQKEKEEKAREAGADEVLIKPFKNDLLYQTISKVVI